MGKQYELTLNIPKRGKITRVKVENGGESVRVYYRISENENELDKKFPIIEASKLSLDDEFLKHKPKTQSQREFKKALENAIKSGLEDFRHPKMDPSEDEYGNIFFEVGHKPATGHSCEWWYKKALEISPERNSRLGNEMQYIAFLGVIIKTLVDNYKYPVEFAWQSICDKSKDIGYYKDSPNWKCYFEPTGKRWFDLANTQKILHEVTPVSEFKYASGSYFDKSDVKPLVNLETVIKPDLEIEETVGWIVMDV